MHKSIKEREQEIIDEQSKMESMNSEELEIKRLREIATSAIGDNFKQNDTK